MIPNVIYRRQYAAEATSCSSSPKIHWASWNSGFIAAFTRVCHWRLFWPERTLSTSYSFRIHAV